MLHYLHSVATSANEVALSFFDRFHSLDHMQSFLTELVSADMAYPIEHLYLATLNLSLGNIEIGRLQLDEINEKYPDWTEWVARVSKHFGV